MNKIFYAFLLIMLFQLSGQEYARAGSPYQISFINPIQMISETEEIHGIRMNLVYGVNRDVSGIDFGMINQVDNEQKGLQFGFFNSSLKTSGVQIGLVNKTDFLHGVQIGLLNFHTHGMTEFFPIINYSF